MTSPISSFKRGKPLPVVAERYARALYDLAVERGQLDMVEGDAKTLKTMMKTSKELRVFLANPLTRRATISKALEALFETAKLSALTRQFMHVSVTNGRTRDLPVMLDAFLMYAAEKRGDVTADVTSAAPLSDAQQKNLKDALLAALKDQGVKSVQLEMHQDKDALGGLSVQVGSWMFDGTLKGRLAQMGRVLKA